MEETAARGKFFTGLMLGLLVAYKEADHAFQLAGIMKQAAAWKERLTAALEK